MTTRFPALHATIALLLIASASWIADLITGVPA